MTYFLNQTTMLLHALSVTHHDVCLYPRKLFPQKKQRHQPATSLSSVGELPVRFFIKLLNEDSSSKPRLYAISLMLSLLCCNSCTPSWAMRELIRSDVVRPVVAFTTLLRWLTCIDRRSAKSVADFSRNIFFGHSIGN